MDLPEARRNLHACIQRKDTLTALKILQEQPSLAESEVCHWCTCPCNHHQCHSVLTALVAADASPFILQQVIDMHPAALYCTSDMNQTFCCGPLHTACANTNIGLPNHDAVIRYLVEQCPLAVSTTDASGNVPLHYALLSQDVSLEVIQCLVKPFPESIITPNHHGETPLQYAIVHASPEPVMQYIAKTFLALLESSLPIALDFPDVLDVLNIPTTFGIEQCQALFHILSHVHSLTCNPSEWTWDALYLLLTKLAYSKKNQQLTELRLEGVPRAFVTANPKLVRAFQQLVSSSSHGLSSWSSPSSLTHIHLQVTNTWYGKNRNADKQCLQSIATALQPAGPALRFALELVSFQLYQSTLEHFLTLARPVSLSLNSCSLYDGVIFLPHQSPAHTRISSTAEEEPPFAQSLEKLELIDSKMAPSTLHSMLSMIQCMPRIRHLKLVFPNDNTNNTPSSTADPVLFDLTVFVTSMLLPPATTLQSLVVKGLDIDETFLRDYAGMNKMDGSSGSSNNNSNSKNNRFATTNCSDIVYTKPNCLECEGDIQYATALNRFGQKVCQNVKQASTDCLVVHLSRLTTFEEMAESYRTVVRYGLLRDCPSLWSSG